MAEIGRPPILRVRHQNVQVLDHRIEIETLEFLGIVERLVHRVRELGVLVQHPKVKLVRPPVAVRPGARPAGERALAFVCHGTVSFSLEFL
jgi:hypothetical protein